METRVTEVADGVHQLSAFVGAPVAGMFSCTATGLLPHRSRSSACPMMT